jgi:hypothetical protein
MGQKLKQRFANAEAQRRSSEYIDDEYHYDKWLTEQAKFSVKLRNFFASVKIMLKEVGKNNARLNLNLIKNVTDTQQKQSTTG